MLDSSFSRPRYQFPDPETATEDGFIGFGADLSPDTLLYAYSKGIYPCYGPGDPICWWSPDPRGCLFLEDFKIERRSLRKIRNSGFTVTFDTCFAGVMDCCAPARKENGGIWIVPEMKAAYLELYDLGYAHSVETWQNGNLVGGLYGVSLGKAFFGESMFHHVTEAGRAALLQLVEWLDDNGYHFLDCQDPSPHMLAMGAKSLSRKEYLGVLRKALS